MNVKMCVLVFGICMTISSQLIVLSMKATNKKQKMWMTIFAMLFAGITLIPVFYAVYLV